MHHTYTTLIHTYWGLVVNFVFLQDEQNQKRKENDEESSELTERMRYGNVAIEKY